MIRATHYTMVGWPAMKGRGTAKHIKGSMTDGAKHWHQTMLLDHFKAGAQNKYDYKPRSAKYLKRKARQFKHGIPLVATGLTRRLAQRIFQVRGTAKKLRGTMTVPFYAKMTPKTRNAPAIGAEMTATTQPERETLAKFVAGRYTERLNSDTTRRTVRL